MYQRTARLLIADEGVAVIAHRVTNPWLGDRWGVTVYWTLSDTGETLTLYDQQPLTRWPVMVVGLARQMYQHGLPDRHWRAVAGLPRPE